MTEHISVMIFVYVVTITCLFQATSALNVRLVNGSDPTNGRVEVFMKGSWGTVCDDTWGKEEARVLCRQLGHPFQYATAEFKASYGRGNGSIHIKTISCKGNELGLGQCELNQRYSHCRHDEDAGVSCGTSCPHLTYFNGRECADCVCYRNNTERCDQSNATCVCKPGFFGDMCECSQARHQCDQGTSYCYIDLMSKDHTCLCNNPNAPNANCKDDYSIRLVDGNGTSGRLEIKVNGTWGTVAWRIPGFTDYFSNIKRQVSKVICKQLNKPSRYTNVLENAYFGQGSGPVHYRGIYCTGKEPSVAWCAKAPRSVGRRTLTHESDLGVVCSDNCPLWTAGPNCLPCPCNRNNTQRCENVNNINMCTCKAGFKGETCDCPNSVTCNQTIATCGMWNGKTECLCRHAYAKQNLSCTDRAIRIKDNYVQVYQEGILYYVCKAFAFPSFGFSTLQGDNTREAKLICKALGKPTFHADYDFQPLIKGNRLRGVTLQCRNGSSDISNCSFVTGACFGAKYMTLSCRSDCPDFKFGINCTDCKCDKNNTASCDKITGACTCKPGFSGDTCSCRTGFHYCNPVSSYCHTSQAGDAYCLCKRGFSVGCNDTGIRLVGTPDKNAGRVELYYNYQWGTICEGSGAVINVRRTACKQAGLPTTFVTSYRLRELGKGPIHFRIRNCDTFSQSLQQCQNSSARYCSHSLDLTVKCEDSCPFMRFGRHSNCAGFCECNAQNSVRCDMDNGTCVCKPGFSGEYCTCTPLHPNCNQTTSICGYINQQPKCLCKPTINPVLGNCDAPVKLELGNSSTSGVPSIFYKGQWLNVKFRASIFLAIEPRMMNYFHNTVAAVLCRSLKLPMNYTVSEMVSKETNGVFVSASCQGNETSIFGCNLGPALYMNRTIQPLLSIVCERRCPPWKYNQPFCLDSCSCNQNNSFFCDDFKGACTCKQGFYGPHCNCIEGRHTCNVLESDCYVDGSSHLCMCNPRNSFQGKNCTNPLRLTNGTSGYVQIYSKSWYNVCFDSQNHTATAKVLCRSLGLPTHYSVIEGDKNANVSVNIFRVRRSACVGNEMSIKECVDITPTLSCQGYGLARAICSNTCPNLTYGQNCAQACPCNAQNTVSCDSKTGRCACKQGYHGYTCDCQRGVHMCDPIISECFMKGSIHECICKPQFSGKGLSCKDNIHLLPIPGKIGSLVQYHSNGIWHSMCDVSSSMAKLVCQQIGGNDTIVGTYDVPGPALNAKSWQCGAKSTSLSECNITTCSGHTTAIICGGCNTWRYGALCEKTCNCNRNNSLTCDAYSGKCVCKPNYHGKQCDCNDPNIVCISQYSYCTNNTCNCKDGVFTNPVQCSGKNNVHYYCAFETNLAACGINSNSTSWQIEDVNGLKILMLSMPYRSVVNDQLELPRLTMGQDGCLFVEFKLNNADLGVQKDNLTTAFTYSVSMNQNNFTEGHVSIPSTTRRIALSASIFSSYGSVRINKLSIEQGSCPCPQFKFGPTCQDCYCVVANTDRCDPSNGRCICKAGYEGDTCSCRKGSHNCNLQTSTCQRWFSRDVCMCKPQYANSSGNGCENVVRLRDGNSTYSGRVEIYRNSEWMTVCDDLWSNNNALVICRMLGLSTFYPQGVYGGVFPSGQSPQEIGMDDIQCDGDEHVLADCDHELNHDCGHDEDAAVICRSECPDWLYGARCANVCDCNRANTDNCDKVTGFCQCKPGWTGAKCECSDTVICNQTYSYCQNDICICREGDFPNAVNCSGLNKLLMFCSFESTTCPFTQAVTDSDDWVLRTGSTPSDDTGPTAAKDGLKYMYLEATSKSSGENVILIYDYPNSTSINCFQFQYHMYGSDMGSLKIKRKVIPSGREVVMFTRTGNQGNQWKPGSFMIPPDTSKILIEAIRGSDYESDVAIDNIYMQKGECECPPYTFGLTCQPCACDRTKSSSCDSKTGKCRCRPGFYGDNCACVTGQHQCNMTSSYCGYSSGSPVCFCRSGYTSSSGCTSNIRMVAGNNTYGRLEVFMNGTWGTICDDMFDAKDALVACRQLGLPTFYARPAYDVASGSGRILLDDMQCTGSEKSLQECTKSTTNNCGHSEDVGVSCLENCPQWTYGPNCNTTCNCNRNGAVGCDSVTGICSCDVGWIGRTCHCREGAVQCDTSSSYCYNGTCKCIDGLFKGANCSDLTSVLAFCSFETGNCPLIQDGNDDFDWTLKKGATPSDDTGPRKAYDGERYMYIEATSQSSGEEAILKLNVSGITTQSCLGMYYHMYGEDMSTFKIQGYKSGVGREVLWQMTGDQGQEWKRNSINVDPSYQMIYVNGRVGSDYKSDIAFDELALTAGECVCPKWTYGAGCSSRCICDRTNSESCDTVTGTCVCKAGWIGAACDCTSSNTCDRDFTQCVNNECRCIEGTYSRLVNCTDQRYHNENVLFYCSFETGNRLCNMSQSTGDNFDWTVNKGKTKSDDTGPGSAYVGSHYLYIEASDPRTEGQNAIVYFQLPNVAGPGCLSLYYHMYGSDMGTFNIYKEQNNYSGRTKIFTVSDNQGNEWKPATVSIADMSGQTILLEGIVGDEFKSDIAIDDMVVVAGQCKCPPWKYGSGCNQNCECNRAGSLSCNQTTGECKCKAGYEGTGCYCRTDNSCDREYAMCTQGGCVCLDGVYSRLVNCSGKTGLGAFFSFEKDDNSSFTQMTNDDFDWTRHTGETPSDYTGPTVAADGTYYLYIEGSDPRVQGDKAVVSFPVGQAGYARCFNFKYHMKGSNIESLQVYTNDNRTSAPPNMVFNQTGHLSSSWQQGVINLKQNVTEMLFEAVVGGDYKSDIAIDELYTVKGRCTCQNFKYGIACDKNCDCDRTNSRSCDSETGECLCKPGWAGEKCGCKAGLECDPRYSTCRGDRCICKEGYYQEGVSCSGLSDVIYYCSFESTNISTCNIKHIGANNTFQWQRHTDSTPSSYTGPMDAFDGNYYFYAEATGRSPGEDAELLIDGIKTRTSSCMEMNYHMKGSDMGDLVVIVIHDDTYTNWNVSGSQGSAWKKLTLNIPKSEKIKIYIIGVKGTDYKSDIAIDNIWMFARPCDCPAGFYGPSCQSPCTCTVGHTRSCDPLTGQCVCNDGYEGAECECIKGQNDCDLSNSYCVGGPGRQSCNCMAGFNFNSRFDRCQDVNECTSGMARCSSEFSQCINLEGSYKCTCRGAKIGDGQFCSDKPVFLSDKSDEDYSSILLWKTQKWMPICNNSWDVEDARVLCKQMYGLSYGLSISRNEEMIANISNPQHYTIGLGDFQCKGSESSLLECPHFYSYCGRGKADVAGVRCNACGGKFTKKVGYLESSKQAYYHLTSCDFLISRPALSLLNITFKTFIIEDSDNCTKDYVEIFDGGSDSAPSLGRYCGKMDEFSLTSSGPQLLLRFKTDHSVNQEGFRALYQSYYPGLVIGDRCGAGDSCLPDNSSCIRGICQCQHPFYHVGDTSCMPRKCGVGDTCLPDNRGCIHGTCHCQRPFYHVGDTLCMPQKEMSEICFENIECLGSEEFSECFNNTCQCREGFNLRSNGLCEVIGAPSAERVSADSNWPVIGSLIALLLIIGAIALIVILVVIMKKRKKTKEPQYWYRELEARSIYNDKTAFPTKSRAYSGELEGGFMNVPDTKAMLWSRGREDSMIPIVSDDEFPDDVIDEIPDISPIPINDFASVYTKKWEDKTLMEEFETLASASSRFPRTVAFQSNNKSKNRNNSYVPFDFNRVKLHRKDDKRDYINASFIKGLQGTCPCYIVTQSPLVDTQNDFWRMIWDTRSTSIVMLDTLSQQESYFPSKTSVPLKFDNITVEAVSCLNMQGFSYRCLRVAKDKKEQRVNHFHFGKTKLEGSSSVSTFLEFLKLLHSNDEQTTFMGPQVVHSRNGCGNAGVYVAVDHIIQGVVAGDVEIDVHGVVKTLLKNRMKVVETMDQYVFINECIMQYLKDHSLGGGLPSETKDGYEESELLQSITKF